MVDRLDTAAARLPFHFRAQHSLIRHDLAVFHSRKSYIYLNRPSCNISSGSVLSVRVIVHNLYEYNESSVRTLRAGILCNR